MLGNASVCMCELGTARLEVTQVTPTLFGKAENSSFSLSTS